MKKIINTIMILFCAQYIWAQNINVEPFVTSATVSPAPIGDVASQGRGTLTFTYGNLGNDPIQYVVGDELKITITLKNGVPNSVNPILALSGSSLSKFTWSYNASTNIYTGVQNAILPNIDDIGFINIDYKVTSNSVETSPNNGFEAKLTIPNHIAAVNTKSNDLVSSYTWTVLKPIIPAPLKSFRLTALPINMLYSKLTWNVEGVKDVEGYMIEKSETKNGEFKDLGIFVAENTSLTYSIIDSTIVKGRTYYYRGIAIDNITKNKTYSNIAIAKFVENGNNILIFPNPVKNILTVSYTNENVSDLVVNLLTIKGDILETQTINSLKGTNELDFNTSGLAAGNYLVSIENKTTNTIESFKITKD